jgi:hypothetical protein
MRKKVLLKGKGLTKEEKDVSKKEIFSHEGEWFCKEVEV